MLTIYTANSLTNLQSKTPTMIGPTLTLPELFKSPYEEAVSVVEFVNQNPPEEHDCQIMTLREVALNIIGHMIANGDVDHASVKVVHIIDAMVTDGGYDENGFLTNLPFGFFDYSDAVGY